MKKLSSMWIHKLKLLFTRDAVALFFIVFVVGFVFGFNSSDLGFYADDANFLNSITPYSSTSDLIEGVKSYVTGRNLHILWHYLVTILSNGSISVMHSIMVITEIAIAVLLFIILRNFNVNVFASFLSVILFTLYPNHGETHFWISSLPMNLISTLLVLLFILCLFLILNELERKPSIAFVRSIKCLTLIIIFFCAMFTYDQAVPVVMTVATASAIYFSYRNPSYRDRILIFWLLAVVTFVTLVIWKVSNPAGGPVFSHLSSEWILHNFITSLKIWIKVGYVPYKSFGSLSFTEVVSVLILGLIFVLAALYLHSEKPKKDAFDGFFNSVRISINDFSGRKNQIFLIASGIVIFFAASLPSYLWSISPRHLYLPSIGVSFFVAGSVSMLQDFLQDKKAWSFFVFCYLTALVTAFIATGISEKNNWIKAYSLRKGMYLSILNHIEKRKNINLLLFGFPGSPVDKFPSLSFLTGEQSPALSIATGGRLTANTISLHPVVTKTGFFINTELYRWGKFGLSYVPSSEAVPVIFDKIENSKIFYKTDRGSIPLMKDDLYELQLMDAKSKNLNNFNITRKGQHFLIDVPNVKLKEGEILAIIPSIFQGNELHPLVRTNTNESEPYTMPIEVSKSQSVILKFKFDTQNINGFLLYAVSRKSSREVGSFIFEN